MNAAASPRLERLAAPLLPGIVAAEVGDIVRLAQAEGAWFYCHVTERMPQGELVCSVVDAQCWPTLLVEGIRPGVNYVVAPGSVLSVVRTCNPRRPG